MPSNYDYDRRQTNGHPFGAKCHAVCLERIEFNQINQSAMHATQAVHRKRDLASPISEVIGVGTLLMILLYGGSVVLTGQGMTGAALVGFVLFFYQLIPAFKAVTMALITLV